MPVERRHRLARLDRPRRGETRATKYGNELRTACNCGRSAPQLVPKTLLPPLSHLLKPVLGRDEKPPILVAIL